MATANPLVITNGFAEVTHRFLCDGDPDVMTFSHGIDNVNDLADLVVGVVNAADTWNTNLIDTLSSAYTYIGANGRTSPTGTNLVTEYPLTQPGTGGPGVLPQNCALIVKKVTGVGGRQHKGRFFMPGMLAEGDVDPAGNIDGAVVTAINTALTDWLNDMVTGGNQPVLFHSEFIRDPANPAPAMIANPDTSPDIISAFQAEAVIATQRRRLR